MEFGILGPLLIRDESGALTVRAAKQRTLLAALLLRAGRVVPAEELVETLWDGRPPPSALPSLRNYVLRLRGGLGAAGRRIGQRDRGYVLEAGPDEVDLLRFDRLREEGTAAFQRGQFALAGRLLARAAQQWRGPALVDVDSDALHREQCPHLAESRLDVAELWLEAEFRAVGRVPWTAQLRELAWAHPERERLWEHLIRSLYRDGRRTEALAEYQRLEALLREQYGVRPGERLRALHGEALGAGARPPTSAVGASPVPLAPVPFQIPAAPADFTGRRREAADLAARLTGGDRGGTGYGAGRDTGSGAGSVVVVSGQPGIGKTALALHAAHSVRRVFPGGVLFADLHAAKGNPAPPSEVLASFLIAFGVPRRSLPAELEDRSALLRSLLADRRALLVLDDAADDAQVRALLPGPGDGAALITARTRLDGLSGAAHLEPEALAAEEATQLLAAIAGRVRTAAEPRLVGVVARACGGLPLALRVAGTRLAARPHRSVRWLADRLADPDALLDELRLGGLDVRIGLAEVCHGLDADLLRAFRVLAAGAGAGEGASSTVSVPAAAALLGVTSQHAENLLEQLVDRYLLCCADGGRYKFRPLTRAYGRELARRSGSPAFQPIAARSPGPAGRPSAGCRVAAAG